VLLFCDPEELRGDAAVNYRVIAAAKTPLHVFGTEFDANELEGRLAEADWIVDALLGTGTRGDIREPYATIIQRINRYSNTWPANSYSIDRGVRERNVLSIPWTSLISK